MLGKYKRPLLFGGLAAAAYMYFNKMENREKAKVSLKNTKTKVANMMETKSMKPTMATKAGHSDPGDPDDNRMVEEGSQYSVMYYNEGVQDKSPQSGAKKAFPKSQQQPMPDTTESLREDNYGSPAKQENTHRDYPTGENQPKNPS